MIVFFCSFVQGERQSLVEENLKNVDMCRRRDLEDLQVQEVRYLAVEYALFPRQLSAVFFSFVVAYFFPFSFCRLNDRRWSKRNGRMSLHCC